MDKTCDRCKWVGRFNPRPDEVERGWVLGCRKPGYEGYTKENAPACDGVFFTQATAQENRDG